MHAAVQFASRADGLGKPVRLELSSGTYAVGALPLRLDNVTASELWIVGGDGVVLDLSHAAGLGGGGGRRLLSGGAVGGTAAAATALIVGGGVTVHLERITLQGARGSSLINVTGGRLRLVSCVVRGASGASAIVVGDGGELEAVDSRFEDNTAIDHMGGAVALVGAGTFYALRSTFSRNSATRGGALAVLDPGALASLVGSTLEGNIATRDGGAIYATAGATTLANGTLLRGNQCGADSDGAGLFLSADAAVAYELPAPLGRWVLADGGVAPLPQGGYGELPYACAPGVFGGARAFAAQSGPSCSGACPEGSYCPSLSTVPLPCPAGSYCPSGSGTATPCEAGFSSRETGLVSNEQCAECEPGYWCTQGASISCGQNTYNGATGGASLEVCLPCPANSQSAEGAAGPGECLCAASYYAANTTGAGLPVCERCPAAATDCVAVGTTLASLPLLPGHWRTFSASTDIRQCPMMLRRSDDDGEEELHSSCRGGGGGGGDALCQEWLAGPLCMLCNGTGARHYDAKTLECLPCDDGDAITPLAAGGGAAVLLLLVGALWARFKPHRRVRRLRRLGDKAERLTARLSLRPKAKQLISFFQIVTRIGEVYKVPMPSAVRRVLDVMDLLNVTIGSFVPLECLSLGTFYQQLLTTMLSPLVVALAIVVGFLLFIAAPNVDLPVGAAVRKAMLRALRWLLLLFYLVFPVVTSLAFRAFDCVEFDSGESYMAADMAVMCTDASGAVTAEYASVQRLTVVAILCYPIAVPLAYVLLLLRARRAIVSRHPSGLSRALAFLHRDYAPRYFYWQVLEEAKKLALVGFASLISPGSLMQLVAAFCFCLVFMLIVSTTTPYVHADDNFFAEACAFLLIAVFFFSVILQTGALTDAVAGSLASDVARRLHVDIGALSFLLVASLVGALGLALLICAEQVVAAARVPTLRLKQTSSPPELQLRGEHRWHLFLSHIWGTGQDQCATIKRQLTLLLPGVSIFLDVDDLQDIGALETYVDQSAVVMIFVSKGYFKSGNCLREARCTVAKQKPIALMHDPVRGGEKLDVIMAQECPDDLRPDVFTAGRGVIEWHRIKDFQLVSLKLLAEQLLLGSPESFRDDTSSRHSGRGRDKSLNKAAVAGEGPVGGGVGVYVPGELSNVRLTFRQRVSLFVSPDNPGAQEAAEALQKATAASVSLVDAVEHATHFLLYLRHDTYLGGAGGRLAAQLRAARAAGEIAVVMAHENDPARGGCEFGRFFETTPGDLIQDGLYSALAFALYPGPFWPVSVALVAKALGAQEARGRGGKKVFTTAAATLPQVQTAPGAIGVTRSKTRSKTRHKTRSKTPHALPAASADGGEGEGEGDETASAGGEAGAEGPPPSSEASVARRLRDEGIEPAVATPEARRGSRAMSLEEKTERRRELMEGFDAGHTPDNPKHGHATKDRPGRAVVRQASLLNHFAHLAKKGRSSGGSPTSSRLRWRNASCKVRSLGAIAGAPSSSKDPDTPDEVRV